MKKLVKLSLAIVMLSLIFPLGVYADGDSPGFYKVSTSSSGVTGNGTGFVNRNGDTTPDGRYVAFSSESSNFIPNDVMWNWDVFRKDTLTNEIIRVNIDAGGNAHPSSDPMSVLKISPDGSKVFFATREALIPEDTNNSF